MVSGYNKNDLVGIMDGARSAGGGFSGSGVGLLENFCSAIGTSLDTNPSAGPPSKYDIGTLARSGQPSPSLG